MGTLFVKTTVDRGLWRNASLSKRGVSRETLPNANPDYEEILKMQGASILDSDDTA